MMSCIKIVTEAIEKKNIRDQRKIKIAILAITTYTSILMCLYNTLQNLWCPSRKTIKYIQYPNKILDFGYLRSAQLGQNARNHPTLTQLVAFRVETQEVDSCNQI